MENELKNQNIIDKGKLFSELTKNFSIDSYETDLNLYYQFLEQYLPDYLYKYLSVSKYSITALVNNTACFSNPNLFNDLFDSGANLSKKGLKERTNDINNATLKIKALYKTSTEIKFIYNELEQNKFFDEKDYRTKHQLLRQVLCNKENENIIRYNNILSEIRFKMNQIYSNTGDQNTNRLFGDITDNVRILCLSESENNSLMWAHYGQNDTGICLKYSKQKILKFLKSRKDIFMLPICYMNTNFSFDEISLELSPLQLLNFFMFKKKDWKYEYEWRLVKYCPNYEYNSHFHQNFVDALFVPCTIPDHYDMDFIEPTAIYLGVKFDINSFENEELKKYQENFLSYVAHNYSKIRTLSVCDATLGYYVNNL